MSVRRSQIALLVYM